MKRRTAAIGLVTGLGLVATNLVAWARPPQTSGAEDEVLKLVRTWLEAESGGDVPVLERLISDDFMGTGPGGNILDKRDIVPPAGEERPRMPKSRLKDSAVRLYGNTAVVMGSVAYETMSEPGFRFTLVFMNRGKEWQIVAAHLVNLPPAK